MSYLIWVFLPLWRLNSAPPHHLTLLTQCPPPLSPPHPSFERSRVMNSDELPRDLRFVTNWFWKGRLKACYVCPQRAEAPCQRRTTTLPPCAPPPPTPTFPPDSAAVASPTCRWRCCTSRLFELGARALCVATLWERGDPKVTWWKKKRAEKKLKKSCTCD